MKQKATFWLGLLVALLTAALTYLTSSCASAQHYTKSEGHTHIVTSDTTHIWHGGNIEIKIK